ncbi:glycosyl hydrolase 115 family protein [Paenibacillus glycanilyticus]|uniref:glycosyl hydrolase 115 family protein n=1 Tax=Paenibacillus glycanilyticus TaxID=126569 RepID=UPI002040F285|nr:glycosyl hydrolase 115 family protein [Paenibacillus glycanilyticus]MCM3628702.1 glycosyl hydrolase 115 family protein [Paenibacillus glycanilyticus]
MIRYTRRVIAVMMMIALFVGMMPAYAASNPSTEDKDEGMIQETGEAGDFPLAVNGTAASIWVDAAEEAPVRRVANDLKDDIKRVTNLDANVSSETTLPAGPVVIVGTLADSEPIKALVSEGEITADEVSAIQNKWEAYLIKVVDENTLVIAGSDNRGAIFGVYELSERMGVSPWYFFADTAIRTKSAVYVAAETSVTDMPDVQYRGVFLNDEEKLGRWAKEVFKDPDNMGPKTYAKIFELILRLKGNYIWAAMHVNSINNVPGNIDLVKEYGIVLGSSHPDMLLRTNTHEWDDWKQDYAKRMGVNPDTIEYDFTASKDAVLQYWRESIESHKDIDAQWTLGMRGIHDEAFNVKNLMEPAYDYLGGDLDERKAGLMNEIIREQQKMLLEILGQEKYDHSFQAFIPYKEVLPIYNHPQFDLPENVTVIWCDDNHGIMRRMPDATERAREGGHGLYDHVSYWAPADQSYTWLNSIPLSLMGEELGKSWDHNIRKSWILNIGDIKPQEAEMTFFIRYGWDVEKYKNNSEQFLKDWIGEQFGSSYSDETADILTTFYQQTNVRKLEHMQVGVFNQTQYGDESSKRMAVYQDLFDRTAAIYNALPEEQKLSFYELVQSKINWAYYVNKAYYYADRSNLASDQGRMASADAFLKLSQEADLAKKAEIVRYSTMAGGKWKGFIDPENASPPVINQLPPGTPALVLGEPSLGVVVQGETRPQENSKLVFSPYNQEGKFIDIFNKGAGSINWTAAADQPWVHLSSEAGTISDETRLWVTIDEMEAHKGATAAITITDTSAGTAKTIQVAIENPAKALSEIQGYAEADGYVSIEAEHYSRLNANGDKTWEIIRDLGRASGCDVVRAYDPELGAVDEAAIIATAPSLEYDINLTSSGQFPLEIYRIPTLNSKGKVRFAVSVDNEAPIVVESAASDEGQGTVWVSNLFHMIEKHVVNMPAMAAGKHTIKLWMVDSFIMIDKMVLYTGPDGVIPTELGPDESYHDEYNTAFNPGVELPARTSTAAEPMNIPSGWGGGAFVEAGGTVGVEAEYAMEHVLDSASQITADMKAYTVSKRDKAVETPGKIPNAWRLTQSDTGMAMRLPDLGGQWTSDAEFPVSSPELTYKINFSNTGSYNVWVRWRYVDNASDSIRGGLDGSNGSFSTDVFFSNNLDEKWHWKNVGKVNVATADEHSFSLWMREDGLYIDRIYLTKSGETPSDALWNPSLRTESTAGQRLQAAVDAKRAGMSGISYPLGNSLGHYRQAAYDSLISALNDAEALAKSGTATQQQADDALNALTAAESALSDSLILTEDGVSYNAYRDFSGDEAGEVPYGFNIEDLTNGAAATVQEEEGNKFLRLTTTGTAGKANLFLPYLGEVTAAGDERIVIEYRARLNTNFQYANGAMTRNDSGTSNYSMVTAFDTGKIMVQNSGSKKSVLNYALNTWYNIKMVANWDAKTYTVYINDDPAPVAVDYTFRHTGGSKLTGQRFGIDGYANASIDFDDFKVMVTGVAKSAPVGLGTSNETAAGANDGRITGVNASMEWSSNDGSTWSNVEGNAIANLSPGTYWIRYRETDTHKASPHAELTLTAPNPVTGVSLDKISAQLYTNHGSSTVQLTAKVEPADAANKTVAWSTSNPAVATVDDKGLVSVHTSGTAVITATTADGGHTASCTVTVSVYTAGGGESSGSTNTSTTVKNEDGSTTIIVTDKTTGTVTETTTWPNGVKVETVTTSLGEVTASVHLPQGVAEARITIPAKNASPSTVAYTVKQDGTRKIIGDSVLTKDGVSFIARGDMTLILIDNKITFKDVPDNHWAAESIAFTASRELFLGTGQDLFTPNASMSRAMLFAVLARLDGVETEGGANWYSKAQDWAVTAGISDGSAPDAAITREQLITLLHRYAGQPAASGNGKSFADSGEISAYAREAMEWAVARGILNGKPRNLLEPASSVTRAEVSAILARFIALRS